MVGSYAMLRLAVDQRGVNSGLTSKHNLICLASYVAIVDKIYSQTVQGLADYAPISYKPGRMCLILR